MTAKSVLVSWNVHGWVGEDGVRDPRRAFEAMLAFGADVVALQEVEGEDWRSYADELQYETRLGTARTGFGNAILVRGTVLESRTVDLTVSGREPRSAIDLVTRIGDERLRIVTTHLGLRRRERLWQAQQLARHLIENGDDAPLVVLGDFNDWTPWGEQLRPLSREAGRFSRVPTFPSRRPLLALDRVAVRTRYRAWQASVVRSPTLRQVSDHLPLRVEIESGREPEKAV